MSVARLGLSLLLFIAAAFAAAEGFVIDHFGVTIILSKDSSFIVEERIDVTFTEPRRGIFRTIPTVLDTGKGVARGIFITGISVTETDGSAVTTLVTRQGNGVNIRMGDADITLPVGSTKAYVITYRVENAMNWFQESDWEPAAQLYWNATGNEWETPIRATDVMVQFPESPSAKGVRAKVFTGVLGSTTSHLVVGAKQSQDAPTATSVGLTSKSLQIQRNQPLQPYEGVTFVLDLPAALVPKPSFLKSLRYLILPNLGFAIPLVILAGMLLAWAFFGKDPRGGPMVVRYDPPDDLSGPEVGTMIDERVDQRDIAAGIIALATKGYLRLEPKEEGLVFKRKSADIEVLETEPGPELPIFEAKLLRLLKVGAPLVTEIELRENVAPHMGELRSALYSSLVDRGYYLRSPETVRVLWTVLGIAVCAALGFLSVAISPTGAPAPGIVGGIIGGIIVVAMAQGMPKRTHKGAKALEEIRGFQDFMRRARKHELEWMSQKHPDEALFEKYLPHAIAFGMTKEWAAAFEGILHEMPRWYGAPAGTRFDAIWFGSDMVRVSNSFGAAASTPPRASGSGFSGGSSGFSGGGFSGGGGGGGGGGSW